MRRSFLICSSDWRKGEVIYDADSASRYPNGLPGGIPSEAFDQADTDRALELAEHVIGFVENRFPAEEATDDAGGE